MHPLQFNTKLPLQEVQLGLVVLNAFLVWVVVPKLRSMQVGSSDSSRACSADSEEKQNHCRLATLSTLHSKGVVHMTLPWNLCEDAAMSHARQDAETNLLIPKPNGIHFTYTSTMYMAVKGPLQYWWNCSSIANPQT